MAAAPSVAMRNPLEPTATSTGAPTSTPSSSRRVSDKRSPPPAPPAPRSRPIKKPSLPIHGSAASSYNASSPMQRRGTTEALYEIPVNLTLPTTSTANSGGGNSAGPVGYRSRSPASRLKMVDPISISTDQEVLRSAPLTRDESSSDGGGAAGPFASSSTSRATSPISPAGSGSAFGALGAQARSYAGPKTPFARSPRTSPDKIEARSAQMRRAGSQEKGAVGGSGSRSPAATTSTSVSPSRHPPPLPSRSQTGSPNILREGSVFGTSSSYSKRDGGVGNPSQADLDLFAHHCRLLYFTDRPADLSAKYISSTLAALPPSHRAQYNRIQSSIRAESHDHATRLRLTTFHALVESTHANASLTPLARAELPGPRARRERKERLARFAEQWCSKSAVGVEPFFRALYTLLRLQSLGPRSVGGAGQHRIVWEMDDAVFMEAGGPDFMNEAVSIIKGVLGFEDVALTSPPRLRRKATTTGRNQAPQPPSRTATQRRDTSSSELRPLVSRGEGDGGDEMARSRSRSDPFESPVRAQASYAGVGKRGPAPPVPKNPPSLRRPSGSAGFAAALPVYDNPLSPAATAVDEPLLSNVSPAMGFSESTMPHLGELCEGNDDDDDADAEEDLTAPRLRLWTFPAHITDIEVDDLLSTLPRFLGAAPGFRNIRIPLPRPPPHQGRAHPRIDDVEAQLGKEPEYDGSKSGQISASGENNSWPIVKGIRVPSESSDRYVRPGTGRLWVGESLRAPGWRGTLWERIMAWFRHLFGA